MFIIPRTPLKRQRENVVDIYDQFTNKYLTTDTHNKSILIEVITDYVDHPIYTYLFTTMNEDNVHHIMGYLRSQQSVKMNFILNHLLNNNGAASK
jgi:hypothetical protein